MTDVVSKPKRLRIAFASVVIVVVIGVIVTVSIWPRGDLTRGDVAGVWVSDTRPGEEPTILDLRLDGSLEAKNVPFGYLSDGKPDPEKPIFSGAGDWAIDEREDTGQQLGLGFPVSEGEFVIAMYFERTPFGLRIYDYTMDPDQSDSKRYYHRQD